MRVSYLNLPMTTLSVVWIHVSRCAAITDVIMYVRVSADCSDVIELEAAAAELAS